MQIRRSLVAGAIALSLFATACGGSATTSAVTERATATEAAASTPIEAATPTAVEQAAPVEAVATSLVAPTSNGGQIDFGSLEGQDVVLWFWAPW